MGATPSPRSQNRCKTECCLFIWTCLHLDHLEHLDHHYQSADHLDHLDHRDHLDHHDQSADHLDHLRCPDHLDHLDHNDVQVIWFKNGQRIDHSYTTTGARSENTFMFLAQVKLFFRQELQNE